MDFKSTFKGLINGAKTKLSAVPKYTRALWNRVSPALSKIPAFFAGLWKKLISLIPAGIFSRKAPMVACPKCKELHEINAECTCPVCGAKYKLPKQYEKYVRSAKAKKEREEKKKLDAEAKAKADAAKREEKASSVGANASKDIAKDSREDALERTSKVQLHIKHRRLIVLSACAIAVCALFIVLALTLFKDKDAPLFDAGEYVNQPVFYTEQDGLLRCAFPNDKDCSVGKGEIVSYLSSSDGKCVYLTYKGAFGSDEASNYVLRISSFGEKIEMIYENAEYMPEIISGGNNRYLYIMVPKDDASYLYELYLSEDSETPELISDNTREIAVSTSGRYALVSLDDSGASKLMLYSAAKDEMTNPGIKNAHPLSVDNKGEYLIYARKSTADSTDIVAERSTTNRVVIPLLKDTELKSVIFSADRRSFSVVYEDRTVFYTCGEDDYVITNTDSSSLFGYRFNENVCHNLLSFKEIPAVYDVLQKDILPHYYFDTSNRLAYRIKADGTKEALFGSMRIDSLKVSENDRVAFVSANMLYSGALNKKNNDLFLIMNFTNKTLIDISPDGKTIVYSDSDGNLFATEYGKENTEPVKLSVDADIVRFARDGKTALVVSGDNAMIVDSKGREKLLCEGIITEESFEADDKLSRIFYTVNDGTDSDGSVQKSLFLYKGKKTALISDKVVSVFNRRSGANISVTRSSYVGTVNTSAVESNKGDTESGNETATVPADSSENLSSAV